MKALISRTGQLPGLERVELTTGPRDLRVSVAAAAINHADVAMSRNHDLFGLPEVVGLGFDFAGIVVEIGRGVGDFGVGDAVAGVHGNAAAASRAHASEVVVPASDVAVLPEHLDFETAAAATLPALTARQALDRLGPERGTLLVTGGGGAVGGWAIALAKQDGWSVTAMTRPDRCLHAVEAGADDVVTSLRPNSYDAVFDAAALQMASLAAVRDGGRFVGVRPSALPAVERGVAVSAVLVEPDGAALASLLALAGKIAPVRVAGRSRLDEFAIAYDKVASGGLGGRWLLIPE